MGTTPPNPQTQHPLREIYAVFCGDIDRNSVARIFQGLTAVMADGISHTHILFQSTGGFVADGICLYNFFRALTIDLTLYNVGSVSSIATVAYLGAKIRKASARSTFMIHRAHVSPQFATSARLQAAAQSLVLDDTRTESILREHLNLSQEKWSEMEHQDVYFTGEDAVRVGIASEVGEFSPPPGTRIFNI